MKTAIERQLKTAGLAIRVYDSLDSTNPTAKAIAADGAPEGTVVIASRQTAGKGTRGRSFYSPDATGLYMSVVLRPRLPAREALSITTAAAGA
ncbi:MAG: biotin--[Clostridia bacterium]|nr:biotin--[acetyl-CoA-carboxylase] ligase [Clostridia bacterium]